MGTESITIRTGTDADREAVLALAPRLLVGVAPWRDQAEALAAGRRWLEGSLAAAARAEGAVFVAAVADQVLGVISIGPVTHFTGERDGYIGELAVAEHTARQGIGRALVAAADTWARDHGLAHLTLHAGARNAGARAFYAALGFTEEEVRLTRPVGRSAGPTGARSDGLPV
jgi:ribosomal protein S18 acetylase RimI-like enzyme